MSKPIRIALVLSVIVLALSLSAPAAPAATTFGSALQNAPNSPTCTSVVPVLTTCHYAIGDITPGSRAAGGLTAPTDGVIVRWRLRTGGSSTSDAKAVLRAFAGNTQRAESSQVSIPVAPGITTSDARIPVKAGDRLGVSVSGTPVVMFLPVTYVIYSAVNAGSLDTFFSLPTNGAQLVPSTQPNNELAVNADIEPDADGDGYGDESQDLCPTSATFQAVCTGTTISSLKYRKGLGFTLTISEASPLDLLVERLTKGRLSKGKCSTRAKRGKRCTIAKRIRRITNLAAGAGATTIPYATSRLRPGSYRATVTAHNASGIATTKTVEFRIR